MQETNLATPETSTRHAERESHRDFAPSETTDKPVPSLDAANAAEQETDLVTLEVSARPANQSPTAGVLPSADKYVSPSALVPIPKAGPRKPAKKCIN